MDTSKFPEQIRSDSFGDTTLGNHYLDQVTVGAGTHQIFYSYSDNINALGPFTFGIQIYNPNSSSITFQKQKDSHRDTITSLGWAQAFGGVWADFYGSSAGNSTTIASNSVYWVRENTIPNNSIFTGNMRFTVSGNATIILYVYKNKSKINGTATAYPWSNNDYQYSGYGQGYFYTASAITLKATELTGGKYFNTNYDKGFTSLIINGQSKATDAIPLTLCTGQSVYAPGYNLGNWAVQYSYTLNLQNNTSSSKTFEGYVRTANNKDNWLVIQSGSACKYASLGPSYGNANAWKWLTKTFAANTTYSDSYQYILGANSTQGVNHIFKVI
jgi:hypothetical protein